MLPPPAGPADDRARDPGAPFEGTPGRWNAITDVSGIGVGRPGLIAGEGALQQILAKHNRTDKTA